MKLVIQIPAFNEEDTLASAMSALPARVPGFDALEIVVVDDGSADRTAEVARSAGASRVIRFPRHRGLAAAFTAGIAEAVAMGADCVVNFDADNQYDAADLPALVAPILEGSADVVVGDRRTGTIPHFSPGKKFLQRAGSWAVRQVSGTDVPDATSGFRALSRHAAESVNVFSKLTYTLETLIQAGSKGLRVASVPVRTNSPTRPSRLIPSTARYVLLSGANILRITALYKPLKVFSAGAALFLLAGAALVARFLWYYAMGRNPAGHVQSLILAGVLLVIGAQTFLIALLADLVSINRTLLEEMKERAVRSDDARKSGGSPWR
jgi:glycosyltransferase involved in cell wall biosynthesis